MSVNRVNMRVNYPYPSVGDFDRFLNPLLVRGSGLDDIRVYRQKGAGLFSFLGRVVRNSIPFLKKFILPEVGNLAKNVTTDISEGKTLRQSLRKHAINSVKNVGKRVVGGSKMRKVVKKVKKRKPRSGCRAITRDVFSIN